MKEVFILDACALISYLNEEPGKDAVKEILMKAYSDEITIIMNKLNLLEVYYDIYRRCGKAAATNMIETIADAPVHVISELSDDVFNEAGRLKATYRISIADSVALAEASVSGGSLLTSDHHEFDAIEQSEVVKFHWIR